MFHLASINSPLFISVPIFLVSPAQFSFVHVTMTCWESATTGYVLHLGLQHVLKRIPSDSTRTKFKMAAFLVWWWSMSLWCVYCSLSGCATVNSVYMWRDRTTQVNWINSSIQPKLNHLHNWIKEIISFSVFVCKPHYWIAVQNQSTISGLVYIWPNYANRFTIEMHHVSLKNTWGIHKSLKTELNFKVYWTFPLKNQCWCSKVLVIELVIPHTQSMEATFYADVKKIAEPQYRGPGNTRARPIASHPWRFLYIYAIHSYYIYCTVYASDPTCRDLWLWPQHDPTVLWWDY